VDRIEARDEYTVVFRLKEPYATLLWNLSEGAIGIVPEGSGENFNQRPVGSGPFKLVRMVQGKEVVLERNDDYWGEKPRLRRVRFAVVPDTTTRALELRKGSADAAINALTADTVVALSRDSHLRVARGPGTIYQYLAINFNDPLLRDVRVRQALAHAINLEPMLKHLWRGMARPAVGILPPEHWAFSRLVREYPHDPKRARQILHAAGYREKNGVRFRLTIKTSTEEISRLLAAVLQQQLRDVGIALDIRTYEFSTFFSDITKGAFQLYSLRWVGGNEDPDIFEYVFHSSSVPPRRANRGYYSNPKVDALIDEARRELDQQKRKALYAELQRTLAEELPYIHLWYLDNVLVYSQRVRNVKLSPSGNYNFLKTVELTP
jgi:peptide/nickel transport system substrate-binding protein